MSVTSHVRTSEEQAAVLASVPCRILNSASARACRSVGQVQVPPHDTLPAKHATLEDIVYANSSVYRAFRFNRCEGLVNVEKWRRRSRSEGTAQSMAGGRAQRRLANNINRILGAWYLQAGG